MAALDDALARPAGRGCRIFLFRHESGTSRVTFRRHDRAMDEARRVLARLERIEALDRDVRFPATS